MGVAGPGGGRRRCGSLDAETCGVRVVAGPKCYAMLHLMNLSDQFNASYLATHVGRERHQSRVCAPMSELQLGWQADVD